MVLGTSQDAGIPQLGNPNDPAWQDAQQQGLATSIALIDRNQQQRFLFEATPDIRVQLQALDEYYRPSKTDLGISGIFLTHAHIGHYAGLMFLGHESASAAEIPVYVMPRMKSYLKTNGPWSQLVSFGNIDLKILQNQQSTQINRRISVTPLLVPHRDEYSETVGFIIQGTQYSALFLPDIDNWDRWESEFDTRIEDILRSVDFAFIDATFFDNHELPGRDMTLIPHPRVLDSMNRFDRLPLKDRHKIRFIHLNHTNPLRYADSEASKLLQKRNYQLARNGEIYCLDSS